MIFRIKKENLDFWAYATPRRSEFKMTYKLPTWDEIKQWLNKLKHKGNNDNGNNTNL